MRLSLTLLLLTVLAFTQVACNSYKLKSASQRETICKELNSRITFNGNTSNNRQSEIADAEDASLQQQYDKYHCADYE